LRGLRGNGDQVVRGVRQGRVVQRPVLLLDHDGFGAHLDHQCLGNGEHRARRGHAEGAVREPGQVQAHAGERHGRMDGQADGPLGLRRREHAHAVPAGGMGHQLARLPGSGLG
jgi:hypothetical protein